MTYWDILTTASGNIFRSKLRTALTIIAIFVGAFTLTLTNGIGAGVSSYIDKQLGTIGAENMLIVQARFEDPFSGGPQPYDPDQAFSSGSFGPVSIPVLTNADVQAISAVPGITSAEPMIIPMPDYIQGTNGQKFRLMMQPYVDGLHIDVAAGQSLDNQASEYQLLLADSFVQPLGFSTAEAATGQMVTLGVSSATGAQQQIQARVVGVPEQSLISSGAGGQSNQSLTQAIRAVQITGIPAAQADQFQQVIAQVHPDTSPEELATIKDTLEQQGFRGTTVEDQIGVFKQVIDAIVMVLNFFAAIALLAASFGIVNTLLMAVQERTKEIGLMKAMGMPRGRIFTLFSLEAVIIGFWGSALGAAIGILAGNVINAIASGSFLQDLPGFDLLVFSWQSIGLTMAIIMGIAFLAGSLPARRAARQNPIDALRYE